MCGEDQRDGEQGQAESRSGSSGASTKLGESGVEPGSYSKSPQPWESGFELDESDDLDCRGKDLGGLFSGLETRMLSSILVASVVIYKP